MRVFIAVEIPSGVREQIVKIMARLQRSGADVKWVEDINLHFTLKFLGEIDEQKVGILEKELSRTVADIKSFGIEIKGLGSFERVVWVGSGVGAEGLKDLAKKIENLTVGMKIAKREEREFVPHIAIGRIRGHKNLKNLQAEIEKVKSSEFGGFEVESLVVMKSTLTPRGPIYERIKVLNLIKEGG